VPEDKALSLEGKKCRCQDVIYFNMWPEVQTGLSTRKNRELPDTAGHKETRSSPVLVTETSAQLGQEWTLST
jgi:hypothetical protein